MIYMPADRPEFLNDPISAYADQLLDQWAWNYCHKIIANDSGGPGKCQCGVEVKNDAEIREHWANVRTLGKSPAL